MEQTDLAAPGGGALVEVESRRTGQALILKLQNAPTQYALDMATALEESKQRRGFERFIRSAAELVFSYWCARYDHTRAILNEEREKVIMARLRESQGDVSELLYAIDGGLKDEWVMGTARNCRKKNDGVLYLFGSRERVEQLAERCRGYRNREKHKMVLKYIEGVDVSQNGKAS